MTVYTNRSAGSRTNKVAVLKKEPGTWGDWQVVSRPETAAASLLPETWGEHPGIISTRTALASFCRDVMKVSDYRSKLRHYRLRRAEHASL